MAMRLLLFGILLAPILCMGIVSDSTSGTDSARIIPKWRFYTEASVFTEPEVGIYRRIGNKWDCGVQLSGRLSASDDEFEVFESRTRDSITEFDRLRISEEKFDHFELALSTDVRRWKRSSDKLSLFHGVRFTVSYGSWTTEWLHRRNDDPDDPDYDSMDEYVGETQRLGLALAPLLGVDVRLLKHISAAVVMAPVRGGVSWRDDESSRIYRDTDGANEAIDTGDGMSQSTEKYLAWNIRPEVYLSINW